MKKAKIERVAWVYRYRGYTPLIVTGRYKFMDYSNDGWNPAVEVKPVLKALYSLREKTNFERERALLELIRQLEEAKKP